MRERTTRGERYPWEWLAFWCLVVVLGIWALQASQAPSYPLKTPPVPRRGVEWFLVVRMPEVPTDKRHAEAAQARFAEWLKGLNEAGFQPMALSTVLSWLDHGHKLPPKTVVFLFYPGYRQTYDAVAPLLAAQGYPAVWLTDRDALRSADHRYVSYRTIAKMRASNVWDIGWFQPPLKPGQALTVELEGFRAQATSPHRFAFEPRIGDAALNRERQAQVLHHLRANPHWSAQELVDRLQVEAPVEGPSHLTVRPIGERPWGAAIEANRVRRPQPFDLQAPLQTRGVSVAWPSTMGKSDFTLRFQLVRGIGDIWLLLRSDRSAGQAIRVGFVDDQIIVEQDNGGQRVRLAAVASPADERKPLTVTIGLAGEHLELSMGPQRLLQLDSITMPINPQGMVELAVSDAVRGAAEVEAARLFFTPAGRSHAGASRILFGRFFRQGRRNAPAPSPIGSTFHHGRPTTP